VGRLWYEPYRHGRNRSLSPDVSPSFGSPMPISLRWRCGGQRMTCDPRQIFTWTRVLHLARQGGLVPPQGRKWSRKQRHTRPARVDLDWLQDRLCIAWGRLQAAQAASKRKPGRGRPSNAPARQFLSDVAAIYSSVGVKWTPAAVRIDKEAPFYKFAACCFELAGLRTGSLRRMIEERGRERARCARAAVPSA
jgi:hypothetical protein